MIDRRLIQTLQRRLASFPAVALLGPRQVGKTTLARMLGRWLERAVDYLDLENPSDRAKLEDPLAYLRYREGHLVIIDEVQRAPGLFQVLRGIIDERVFSGRPVGHFLLLGSASVELLRQSSESLAGRVATLHLGPMDPLELPETPLDRLWVRGGFPRSILAPSDEESAVWRAAFIATYLERDIPQLGPRIPSETLRRFWTMLAHSQGGLLNAAQLGRSLAIDGKTVARYLDLMVDLLLVRRLEPFHANIGKRLVRSPKTYVRDSGLVHSLLRLETLDQVLGHPIAGLSWEGFVIESLLNVAPERARAAFFRTTAGAEIDLILELPGGDRWAVEVKRSLAPKVGPGLRGAAADVGARRTLVVYPGVERYPNSGGVEVLGVRDLCEELRREAGA